MLLSRDCNRFHGISTWTGVIGSQAKHQREKRSRLDNRASATFKAGKDCDELPGERNRGLWESLLHMVVLYTSGLVFILHMTVGASHVLAEYQELQD